MPDVPETFSPILDPVWNGNGGGQFDPRLATHQHRYGYVANSYTSFEGPVTGTIPTPIPRRPSVEGALNDAASHIGFHSGILIGWTDGTSVNVMEQHQNPSFRYHLKPNTSTEPFGIPGNQWVQNGVVRDTQHAIGLVYSSVQPDSWHLDVEADNVAAVVTLMHEVAAGHIAYAARDISSMPVFGHCFRRTAYGGTPLPNEAVFTSNESQNYTIWFVPCIVISATSYFGVSGSEPYDGGSGAFRYLKTGGFPLNASFGIDTWDDVNDVIYTGSGAARRERIVGPVVHISDANFDDQTFWENAYEQAVADGLLPSGLQSTFSGGFDYPETARWGALPSTGICAPEVTLAQITHLLATRSGVPPDKIDVSELTELVYGHAVGRPSTTRRIIEQLQMYGMFSLVDRGDRLKAVLRSTSPSIVVPYADMGAHEEGDDAPPRLSIRRTQDPELPRTMRLSFAQITADLEEGQSAYTRQQTTSINTRDVQLPIAMSDTKAAQIPEIWVTVEWVGREQVTFSLPAIGAYREELFPGAPVTLTQENGDTIDVMITRRTYTFPGLLQFEARRHDPAAYESEAVGVAPIRPPTLLLPPGDTAGFLIDGPMLRDEDNNAGYYAAMYGGSTWRGGTLFRSTDGGASFDPVASLGRPGTIGGVVDDPVPAGPTTVWDLGNEIVVQIIPGRELESRSVEDVIAGANAAAYQVRDGQGQTIGWEILQFVDADQTDDDEYTLTTLLRGRRGTEWAVGLHQAGDVLLMLGNVVRVPSQLSDVGQSRPHRAVSFGLSVNDALTLPFTPRGRSLQPFSPVHIRGERDGPGDLTITWVRRSRTGEALHNGVDTPLGEETEAYEVDVMDGSTVVRTIAVTSPEAVYTASQQSSDFGSAQSSVEVRVYQMSATVGRGVAGEATV